MLRVAVVFASVALVLAGCAKPSADYLPCASETCENSEENISESQNEPEAGLAFWLFFILTYPFFEAK